MISDSSRHLLATALGALAFTAALSRAQDPAAAPELDALALFEEVLRQRVVPPRAPNEQGEKAEEEEDAEREDEAAAVWSRSLAIEGLVEIYRRRREDVYLERALALSEELLGLRDSAQKRRDPKRKATLAAWSARSPYPQAFAPVDPGAATGEREPSPALTALAVASGMELVLQIEGEARLMKLWKRAAQALEKELQRALACFDEEYMHAPAGKEGYYYPLGETQSCLPSADLALLARAHLALSRGKKGEHLDRGESLARFLRSRLVKGPDGVTLRWAPLASPNGRGGKNERCFHAGLIADLVRRAEPHGWVFEAADRKAMRETFQRIVYASAPRIPRILDQVRPDESSEMAGLEEALPWLWAAASDPAFRDAALDVARRLGANAPAEALPMIAALVEPVAAAKK
ncbi:MAG: hypothetical protein JNM84_01750 [Planctomycetes bacterium]|nr:hypothetical protein [Planctomycetota bacterium]